MTRARIAQGFMWSTEVSTGRNIAPAALKAVGLHFRIDIGVHDAGEEFFGKRSLPRGIKIDLSATTFPDNGIGGKRTRFKGRGTSASGTVYLVNSQGMAKKIIVSSTGRIRTE